MIPLGALIEWANDVLADYLVGAVLVILTDVGVALAVVHLERRVSWRLA